MKDRAQTDLNANQMDRNDNRKRKKKRSRRIITLAVIAAALIFCQINLGYGLSDAVQFLTYRIKEIYVDSDGSQIYGIAYVPLSLQKKKYPLIIFCHGLGRNHTTGSQYAIKLAAAGYAVYTFDFRGGSADSVANKSDGDSTKMSVMTEADDLESVLNAAQHWDFVDTDRIVLAGTSQGSFVSAVVAARYPEKIKAMILLYPAFGLYDFVHYAFSSKDAIPDTFDMGENWITAGRVYAEDLWDYDPYENIGAYTGPVLILHGDHDQVADISYARRATDTYANAEFHVIRGGSHGFHGKTFTEAVRYMKAFLQEQVREG